MIPITRTSMLMCLVFAVNMGYAQRASVFIYYEHEHLYIDQSSIKLDSIYKHGTNDGEISIQMLDTIGSCRMTIQNRKENTITEGYYEGNAFLFDAYDTTEDLETGIMTIGIMSVYQPLRSGQWTVTRKSKVLETLNYNYALALPARSR